MERHSEKKANLEFAEVTTNCSNFYCKATYKGSEGFGPLQGGLSPESPQNDIYLHGFGAKAPFERLQKAFCPLGLFNQPLRGGWVHFRQFL